MPLMQFVSGAHRVAELCDLLEALADDLPRKATPVWREAVRLSVTVVPEHIKEMTCILLPVLRQRTKGDALCEAVLRRVQTDYDESRSTLPELTELLEQSAVNSTPGMTPEALGFALRGHFEMIRRHIGWETDVVLPLAKSRLTDTDLRAISNSIIMLQDGVGSEVVLLASSQQKGRKQS